MSDLTIGHFVLVVCFTIISIFAVKIAIKFDLNEFLKRKDEKLTRKIQMTCPHFDLNGSEKNVEIENLFISPPGIDYWFCRKCGFRSANNIENGELLGYVNDINDYKKRIKKLKKLTKKL